MDNCKHCIYEEYAEKLNSGIPFAWGSSEPHPCMICRRLKEKEKPDNYRGKNIA